MMITNVVLGVLLVVTVGTAGVLELSNLKKNGRKLRERRPGRLILF